MREFFAYLALCLTAAVGSTLLIALLFGTASADEITKRDNKTEIVQDYVQCTYVPKPSDMVFYQCADLVGKVQIKLSICGQAYTIDVTCPTVSVESTK